MSKYNLENLSDAAVGAELAQPHHEYINDVVIAVNKNTNLIDMEQFEDGKRRKTGSYRTHAILDFVRFVKDETQPENCKIFVNDSNMTATAYLNYGADGFAQGKLDYTARVELRKTPIFDKLFDIHDRLMSQREFIDFLTDYSPVLEADDIEGKALNMGQAINQLRNINIDETKNSTAEVQNFGETRSTFEKVQARTASSMPVSFAVEDTCYHSLPITQITMRLVIVAKDSKPYFKLLINALDLLKLERADKFVELINAELAGEFDVLLGGFNA